MSHQKISELEENLRQAEKQGHTDPSYNGKLTLEKVAKFAMDKRKRSDKEQTVKVGGLSPAVFQTIGNRNEQNDRYAIAPTSKRTPEEVVTFLKDSFERIHQKIKEANLPSAGSVGSTANIVYLSKNTLTVANVGDASTVLLVRHIHRQRTHDIKTIRLSANHNYGNPHEKARVDSVYTALEQAGKTIDRSTLTPEKITRNLNGKDSSAVLHTPQITQLNIEFYMNAPEDTYELYVINACDGLYPKDSQHGLREDDLAKLAKQYFKNGGTPEALPKLFARTAQLAGSEDNITVNVTKIEPTQHTDVVMGIFDGNSTSDKHDGATVANIAAEEMKRIARETYKEPERKTIYQQIRQGLLPIKPNPKIR